MVVKRLIIFSFVTAVFCHPPFTHADTVSTSIMRPTSIETQGVIRGALPKTKTSYYFSLDAKSGDLLTQLSLRGAQGVEKQLELALLDRSAKVQDSYWVHGGDANTEATRSFAIDDAGKKVLRVTVQGLETGGFCVLLGGSAFTPSGEQDCWPSTSDAEQPSTRQQEVATTDLRSAKIEVVESKCEQRLRIGADVLFDFDKADPKSNAAPTLNAAATYLKTITHVARVEGHTDAKGTDAYNQTLSEKRAASVRSYLIQQGVDSERISSAGFGKTRPVAPNTQVDGSDDPAGRQKNRRVEIVLDTCDQRAQLSQ
jgi:outer membrane protein OmpA-like peptidoglycan-associated protein